MRCILASMEESVRMDKGSLDLSDSMTSKGTTVTALSSQLLKDLFAA